MKFILYGKCKVDAVSFIPLTTHTLGKGRRRKKIIESVIMIIPRRTPPPSFLKNVIALRFFFATFFINWMIQVCLETHFGYV